MALRQQQPIVPGVPYQPPARFHQPLLVAYAPGLIRAGINPGYPWQRMAGWRRAGSPRQPGDFAGCTTEAKRHGEKPSRATARVDLAAIVLGLAVVKDSRPAGSAMLTITGAWERRSTGTKCPDLVLVLHREALGHVGNFLTR